MKLQNNGVCSGRRLWFVALVFVLALTVNGFSQQLNTFDGKSIELVAPDNGNRCVTGFGGNPTISRADDGISGNNNDTIILYTCQNDSQGQPIPYKVNNVNVMISEATGAAITRDEIETGYWCFRISDAKARVQYTVGSNSYDWKWLPNTNTTGFYNVKDFGAKGNGYRGYTDPVEGNRNASANDTLAIKNAIVYAAAKQGGTLYFPEGVYPVDSTLNLPPGIIIKGTSGMASRASNNYFLGTYNKSNSTIVLRGDNKPLFRIGECVYGVKITNIDLKAESYVGTSGVEMVGAFRTGSDTQHITFENVAFTEFNKGIYLHAVDSQLLWHADYINVDHCVFTYNKTAGIDVNTYNTDWKISSSVFIMTGAGDDEKNLEIPSDGIVINQGGAFTIENTFAGGIGESLASRGGTFIKAPGVGALTVLNSSSERANESISYGATFNSQNQITRHGSYSNTLTLINNVFGDPINIYARVNFVSTGNQYSGKTVNVATIPDKVARIYSTGDRFCLDISSSYAIDAPCGRDFNGAAIPLGEAGFQGNGLIVFQTGQPRERRLDPNTGTILNEMPSIPSKMKGDLEINGNDRELYGVNSPANSRPILSVTVDSDGTTPLKPLIRLGHNPFVYNIERDERGWLKFSGTQDPPYRGFYFANAPFQLPSFSLTDITGTNFSLAQAGTLVYCSNCTVNTAPCTAGGNGAMALKNGAGQWDCK